MNRHRVTISYLLVSIFVLVSGAHTGPFLDPGIPDGEVLHYRYLAGEYADTLLSDIKVKEEIVTSSSRIEVVRNEKGLKVYRVIDQSRRRNGYQRECVSELLAVNGLEPLKFTTSDRNPEGRLIRRTHAVFDDPALSYPPGTFPVFCLTQALRGIPFGTKDRVRLHIWLAPAEILSMSLEVIREETVAVPAGKIPCFLVEMRPEIQSLLPVGSFLTRLLNPFVPKHRFWFACEGSHPMVRFEGVLGAWGAVRHQIELTVIEEFREPPRQGRDEPLPGRPLI